MKDEINRRSRQRWLISFSLDELASHDFTASRIGIIHFVCIPGGLSRPEPQDYGATNKDQTEDRADAQRQ